MNAHLTRLSGDHRYYVAAAAGIITVVLAGFSIDMPLLSHPRSVSALVRLHGVVILAWIPVFFTQALPVARERVRLHMRLGIFGAVLALIVVVADTSTLIVACRLGGHHMPPGMPRSLFPAFGLFNLLTFAILVGAALTVRRRLTDWHKRLMLLAAILLLDAALARFIGAYTSWSIDASTLRNLLMFACIAIGTWRHRRLHPAFVVGGALAFANDYVASWAAGTAARAKSAAAVVS